MYGTIEARQEAENQICNYYNLYKEVPHYTSLAGIILLQDI